MAEELYLNNLRIDLPVNVVSQTLQINDVGDVVDRQANYSNNIKIPRTANNIKALEMLGVPGSATRYPYLSISVKYIIDGIELISDGKGVVKNTDEFYNLVIYDGAISLSELLGNSTLEELDLSAYDHTLTTAEFFDSMATVSGYTYAIGQFNDFKTVDIVDTDITLQNVSFYIHTLMNEIFTSKGWILQGSVLSGADYRSRLISMAIGHDRTSTLSPVAVYSNNNTTPISETFGTTHTTKTYILESYTILTADSFSVDMIGQLDLVTGTLAIAEIAVNGVLKAVQALGSQEITTIFPVNLSKDLILEVGDIVTTRLKIESELSASVETIVADPDITTDIIQKNISIPIVISDLIGSNRQIDLVKDVLQRLGLVFRKIRNENKLEFVQMDTILTRQSTAEDWSSKYSGFKSESYVSGYGQSSLFKSQYTSDDSGLTYADGEMLVTNVNLVNEKTMLTSLFTATNTINGIAQLKHWVEDNDGVITANEDEQRIYKLKTIGSNKYIDPSLVGWQTEIDNNYVEFNLMLNNYKKINLMVNLNLIDIYSIDFFRLKYFNQLGRYYYLNKVSDFKKNKLTMCEFVQVGTL